MGGERLDGVDRVAIVVTWDTKSEQASGLIAELALLGVESWVVDVGRPGRIPPPQVATSAVNTQWPSGTALEQGGGKVKANRMAALASGAGELLQDAYEHRRLDAVIGIGGGNGTWIATRAMQRLPVGFPKLMVTTMVHHAHEYTGDTDIVYMPSITDLEGQNHILDAVLRRAAGSIIAMIRAAPAQAEHAPLVPMTLNGLTGSAGRPLRQALVERGFDVPVFHANGVGGQVMERIVSQRPAPRGVLDLVLTDALAEFLNISGQRQRVRLRAIASSPHVPRLLIPGGVDFTTLGSSAELSRRYADRPQIAHTPTTTLMRTSEQECFAFGVAVGEVLNSRPAGRVRLMVPRGGFSALDMPEAEFSNPIRNKRFVNGVSSVLEDRNKMIVSDRHISDRVFVELVVDQFASLYAE